MKVTNVRVVNICVPHSAFGEFQPLTMWFMVRYAALRSIVFIDTDECITGIGECHADATETIEPLKRRIIGEDPYNTNAILRRIEKFGGILYGHGHIGYFPILKGAAGAIDMALWDIIGKDCDKPIYKMIGGKCRPRVETRAFICALPPREQAAMAVKCVEAGWKALKIKAGINPEHDLACAKAVREAVGDHIEIGFDYNGRYTTNMALRLIKKMERYDPSHIEEPVDSFNIDALARVRRKVDTPILCCGRSSWHKESILRLIERDACDAVNLYLGQHGFLETQRIAAVAEAGGLVVSVHSGPGELGIFTAAQLHLITATPNFTWVSDTGYLYSNQPPSRDIITKPFKYENGTMMVPEGPGLGVEIEEESFEEARRRYETELDRWQHIRGPDARVPSTQDMYFYDYPEKYEWQANEWPFKGGWPYTGSPPKDKRERTYRGW